MHRIILTLTGALLLTSCGLFAGKAQQTAGTENKIQTESVVKTQVDTIRLVSRTFKSQLISNGKLRAQQKSDLKFATSATVTTLNVSNGSWVDRGSIIASVDSRQAGLDVKQAKIRLEKTTIDLQDALLGFGYSYSDTLAVPDEILRIAKIRSGYDAALSDLETAKLTLQNSTIRAPFSGRIANLKTKLHENPKGDYFCTIINDKSMDVEFVILESELSTAKVGGTIQISTFNDAGKRYKGAIKSINPTVDDKGQVLVTGVVSNSGNLMDGMNVKVYIENSREESLVVPKSAVLVRDNLNVLFRLSPDGHAMWTYVVIEAANSDSYAVVANKERNAELRSGDVVITSGNFNLADNAQVEVQK